MRVPPPPPATLSTTQVSQLPRTFPHAEPVIRALAIGDRCWLRRSRGHRALTRALRGHGADVAWAIGHFGLRWRVRGAGLACDPRVICVALWAGAGVGGCVLMHS
eukprot:gene11886-biopygen19913